jgi:hypothetical protein
VKGLSIVVVVTLDDRIIVDFISSKDIIFVVVLSRNDSSRKNSLQNSYAQLY